MNNSFGESVCKEMLYCLTLTSNTGFATKHIPRDKAAKGAAGLSNGPLTWLFRGTEHL